MKTTDDKILLTQELVSELAERASKKCWKPADVFDVGCWFLADVIGMVSEHRLVSIDELQRRTKEKLSDYLDDVFDNIRQIENEIKEE